MSAERRDLRVRLRARARQLGDKLDQRTREHGIEHLVADCAYEHWHRMLFARFLAENQVLMHPDGVPVTLDECEELASEEGAADGWELASWYAAKMLPQIFRPGSPIFEIKLSPETVRALKKLVDELPPEVFKASDSLGWVYQFWQAKKKDEVNKSEVKIGADELPAVTQLFTEPYMVQFLLHNTLGAWWIGRHGRDSLPIEMPYLRILENGTPAAGTFDCWPKTTAELKVLDPSCGSGHFLVAAFEILVRFRMLEEGLSAADSCAAVLRGNLHGLEIDERCTQIAAFALALAAWTFPEAGGYRALPKLSIACSGLASQGKKDEWLNLAGEDVQLKNGMEHLYSLFQDAPVLGSLIDPSATGFSGKQQELGVASFETLRPLLDSALIGSPTTVNEAERYELGVTARGIFDAGRLLGKQYTLIATNVPYLARGKQTSRLQEFCEAHFDDAKTDLATVFLSRVLRLAKDGGTISVVVPQNWLYQAYYRLFRSRLLRSIAWRFLARLGSGAFEMISGEVVGVGLFVADCTAPEAETNFAALDAADTPAPQAKAAYLRDAEVMRLHQSAQRSNPDSMVILDQRVVQTRLNSIASYHNGMQTGDFPRYGKTYWEVPKIDSHWSLLQSTVRATTHFGGLHFIVAWGKNGEALEKARGAVIRGAQAWGRPGVAVSAMGALPSALYCGELYDDNTVVLIPEDERHLAAVWAFVSSQSFHDEVRKISRALKVRGPLVKVPFDYRTWQDVAAKNYPNGLPDPYSEDPTQWIFRGIITPSTTPLQVAIARLLGYRWPDQADDGLEDLLDDDGIVCLPAVRGEQPAAARLAGILASAYGPEWSSNKQAELMAAVDCPGWTLERWLSERFFKQHCDLFQQRPFIWHIWDGLKKGGFGALVNYHKLDRRLLDSLTYTYLGDWLIRQQDDIKRGVDGAEERLEAARALQEKLKRILQGEPPCDIFVRWKPIEEQPLGWEPDLNDGVRLNIRPFMLCGDVGKKGAGLLREKPKIKWTKDRGKDPSEAPWYRLGLEYGGKEGDRINDHHLSLAEKQAARREAGGGK